MKFTKPYFPFLTNFKYDITSKIMYQTSKIVISPRVRKSPYFDSTMKYGAAAFTIYNHMYMPIVYEGPEKDYENLLNGVQLWDVGVERHV